MVPEGGLNVGAAHGGGGSSIVPLSWTSLPPPSLAPLLDPLLDPESVVGATPELPPLLSLPPSAVDDTGDATEPPHAAATTRRDATGCRTRPLALMTTS